MRTHYFSLVNDRKWLYDTYKILEFKIIENVLIKKAEFQLAVNSKFKEKISSLNLLGRVNKKTRFALSQLNICAFQC